MKGVLAIAHAKQRFVFHAVHMLMDGTFEAPWADGERRESKLVFIGKNLDPKALNASELAAVFGSPYMFARKLDLDLDPNVLRVWDPWMAAKLAGGRPAPPQAPIGHSPGDPDLSIRFRPPGMRDEAGEARLEALGRPRRRRVARLDYEDGSSCGCGEACEANDGGCCEGAHAAACDASAQQLEVDYEGVPLERCPTICLGGGKLCRRHCRRRARGCRGEIRG